MHKCSVDNIDSPIAEVMEHSVSVSLKHAGMRVEAGVAQFRDLLGQQLDAVGRVAENDRLVDLKLKKR